MSNVQKGLPKKKSIEYEVEEGDDMDVHGKVTDGPVEQLQNPVNLGIYGCRPQKRVYEHPLDFISTEHSQVEECIDQYCKSAMQVEEKGVRCLVEIRHSEARAAKDQHVQEEKGVDLDPRYDVTLSIVLVADSDAAVCFHDLSLNRTPCMMIRRAIAGIILAIVVPRLQSVSDCFELV